MANALLHVGAGRCGTELGALVEHIQTSMEGSRSTIRYARCTYVSGLGLNYLALQISSHSQSLACKWALMSEIRISGISDPIRFLGATLADIGNLYFFCRNGSMFRIFEAYRLYRFEAPGLHSSE